MSELAEERTIARIESVSSESFLFITHFPDRFFKVLSAGAAMVIVMRDDREVITHALTVGAGESARLK